MNKEELMEHQKNVLLAAANENLRDYFAAAALTGMYAGYQGNAPEPEQVASDAYFIADMMLKEREK